jgi:hypothetical protein
MRVDHRRLDVVGRRCPGNPRARWEIARMKRWGVLVNGTNFRLNVEDGSGSERVRRMGFYTAVYLTARTEREAERKAMGVLGRDPALRASIRNAPEDPPVMFTEEIRELRSFSGCKRPRTDFVFYAERGPRRRK